MKKTTTYLFQLERPTILGPRYYDLTVDDLTAFLTELREADVDGDTTLRVSVDPDDPETWGTLRAIEARIEHIIEAEIEEEDTP